MPLIPEIWKQRQKDPLSQILLFFPGFASRWRPLRVAVSWLFANLSSPDWKFPDPPSFLEPHTLGPSPGTSWALGSTPEGRYVALVGPPASHGKVPGT